MSAPAPDEAILAALDAAAPVAAPSSAPAPQDEDEAGEPAPSGGEGDTPDMDIVEACAGLDHSDTDNARRFLAHFGRDYVCVAEEGATGGPRLCWAGTHWDMGDGASNALALAMRLGFRIGLEAEYLGHTPAEAKAIKAARDEGLDPADLPAESPARKAHEALEKRKGKRRAFGVSSKNVARLKSALDLADVFSRRRPEMFNMERLKVATATHTLAFTREIDQEAPDPAATRFLPAAITAMTGHRREDWITACVPQGWAGLDAPAPRWRDFLARMLPDAEKRRTVQQFSGLGLTAVPLQYIMFHYGTGANGKSVFLETLVRVLGPGLTVSLPRESIVGGGERGAGGASPDIVRLYGKRMVRIAEVKGEAPLQEDLVKRLTGGEALTARGLFKGYFDFQNVAKAHMSGNGFPSLDGSDYGTIRRLLVVHWDQTIPEAERRDFEDVVSEMVRAEAPGILAWLAEGVLDYLNAGGLFVAPAVRAATEDYRDEQDPIGEFLRACVKPSERGRIGGGAMFDAYESWRLANGKPSRSQKKVGSVALAHVKALGGDKSEIGGRNFYTGVDLQDVPARPESHAEARG